EVEAVAPHECTLNKSDARPEPGTTRRGDQACGPGPNHHKVVTLHRLGIDPVTRMDVRQQLQVVGIARLDGEGYIFLLHRSSLIVSRRALRAMRVMSTVTAMVANRPTKR